MLKLSREFSLANTPAKSSLIRRGLVFAISLAFVLSLAGPVWAQEVTASITGVVTDASGGAVVGAKVQATDLDRGTIYPTTTNSVGQYYLPRVAVGRYTVRVEATGFQTAAKPNIELQLNQAARVDFSLQVGSVNQTVEVTTAAPILQTESTQLGTIIDARTNEQLPLATRNYVQLTLLSAGSITTDPSEFTGAESSFVGGRPYIHGNREEANNFLLDGLDNNQVSENAVAYSPSVDAIQEFNMIAQNASAEFGNFMGGIVSVSIKSGTNQFHGGAFEFIRNDDLNANSWTNNWNDLPRPLLRWNEFGGQAGGPIRKDKLFFFADYQGSRFDQPSTSSPFTVLTTAERTGDFSQLGTPITDPCTHAAAVNNNISDCLSPVAEKIVNSSLYPTPINGNLINNAINVTHQATNGDQGDVKIDWNISDKDRVFGRYSQSHILNPLTNSIALLYNEENSYPSHNGVLDYTRTISPSLVNELRFGINYVPVNTGTLTGSALTPQSVGIADVPTNVLPGMIFRSGNLSQDGLQFSVAVQGTGIGMGSPEISEEFSDTVIQGEDTAIWSHGPHVTRFGFQVFRDRIDTFYSGNAGVAGQFDFSGQYTGAAEADFMAGLPTEVQGGISGGTWGQRATIYSSFAQDDWRISRNLTLNLGLRWELHTPWVEVANRQANFGLLSGQEEFPGQNGMSDALYNQYNGITNFQPRIGIAWTPWNGTVIRTAYTLSSFLEGTGTNLRLTLNPPFATEHDISYTTSQTPSTLADGYAPFVSNAGDQFAGASLRVWDPNVRPAVSNQWNFSIQHQFTNSTTLQATYVGQRNTHLMVPIMASQEILNADGTVSPSLYLAGNPTLQSEIGHAKLTDSNGNQDYQGLELVFQKRLSNGLELQANYTWSKCMTNSIGYYGAGGQAQGDHWYWQNTYDSAAEWGPCYYDVPQAFNGYVTYDVPFGRGRTFGKNMNPIADSLLGGWQVNAIFNLHSGFPITILSSVDTSGTNSAGPRGSCIASGNVLGEQDSPSGGYQWFAPTSYAMPATGTFGNCGVGTISGPPLHTLDFSLSKTFKFTERQNLEFRAEAINLTNTPILNAPADTLPAGFKGTDPTTWSGFGLITSSQGERNIQFGLKYHF